MKPNLKLVGAFALVISCLLTIDVFYQLIGIPFDAEINVRLDWLMFVSLGLMPAGIWLILRGNTPEKKQSNFT